MRFINLKKPGGPEMMFVDQTATPTVGQNDILIKVYAAGVNRPDIFQRRGEYPPPQNASQIMGLEVSGVVEKLGPQVKQWKIGDKVCALVNGGGYAEYVAVPAGQVLPIPKGLNFEDAASLPETFFTVWGNVFKIAKLKAGESILIHGGSSGIGAAAIQLAKVFGAKVYVTVGNNKKAQFCKDLGADHCINYREFDFVEVIQKELDGGIDVILDMVGGDYVQKNLNLLKRGGRLVQIAFLGSSKVNIDLSAILRKSLTYSGSTLRPQTDEEKAELARELYENVWPLLESKKVRPTVYQVFPFEQVAAAHRLMETSEHMGKIVLQIVS